MNCVSGLVLTLGGQRGDVLPWRLGADSGTTDVLGVVEQAELVSLYVRGVGLPVADAAGLAG
jgi:hypothetical protein